MANKDPAAVLLGRRGGKATARSRTAKQRAEQARKAAQKRWGIGTFEGNGPSSHAAADSGLGKHAKAAEENCDRRGEQQEPPWVAAMRIAIARPTHLMDRVLVTDHYKRQFRNLCEQGVEPNILAAYLTLIVTKLLPEKRSWTEYVGLHNKNEFKKLPRDIAQIADRIEQLSRCEGSELAAPENLLHYFADAPAELLKARSVLYRRLPMLLRCYAQDLRNLSDLAQRLCGPKRYNSRSGSAAELLALIDKQTGSPQYEAVADLLSACFLSEGTDGPKGLTSPEGLAKIYMRYSKRGFIPPALRSDRFSST